MADLFSGFEVFLRIHVVIAKRLSIGDDVAQCLVGYPSLPFLVLQHVRQAELAVPPLQKERDLTVIKDSYKRWPRDPKQIRGLLR